MLFSNHKLIQQHKKTINKAGIKEIKKLNQVAEL